jgi:hypothetical protein
VSSWWWERCVGAALAGGSEAYGFAADVEPIGDVADRHKLWVDASDLGAG